MTTREERFRTIIVKSNRAITFLEEAGIISSHEILRGPSETESSRAYLQVTGPHFSFITEVRSLPLMPTSLWDCLPIGNVNALMFNNFKDLLPTSGGTRYMSFLFE